jgi:hypothetical protein
MFNEPGHDGSVYLYDLLDSALQAVSHRPEDPSVDLYPNFGSSVVL